MGMCGCLSGGHPAAHHGVHRQHGAGEEQAGGTERAAEAHGAGDGPRARHRASERVSAAETQEKRYRYVLVHVQRVCARDLTRRVLKGQTVPVLHKYLPSPIALFLKKRNYFLRAFGRAAERAVTPHTPQVPFHRFLL